MFGGSNVQVSGPTGAMTVVLAPVVAKFGFDGVVVVAIAAGVVLMLRPEPLASAATSATYRGR